MLRAFLGAELSLQATINFERETGFGWFDRSAGHSVSIVTGARGVRFQYGESGAFDKTFPRIIKAQGASDSFAQPLPCLRKNWA
jgi:hypothetical protein